MRACKRENGRIVDDSDDDAEFLMSSDEEAANPEPPAPEVLLVVEKILGRKMMPDPDAAVSGTMVEMFFVKWRGLSWLWVSWEKQGDIERVDPQGRIKVKRFISQSDGDNSKGKGNNNDSNEDEEGEEEGEGGDEFEYFDPDYAEVHRILECDYAPHECRVHSKATSVKQIQNSNAPCLEELKYLVKWRSLPYSECTWERFEDIRHSDNACSEVFRFWRLQTPKAFKTAKIVHPELHQYKRLLESPDYGASVTSSCSSYAMTDSSTAAAAVPAARAAMKSKPLTAQPAPAPAPMDIDEDLEEGEEGEIDEEAVATASAAVEAVAATEQVITVPAVVPAGEEAEEEEDTVSKTPALHLRDYQLEGVNWLLWNWWHHRPCVLADEMGLGKTIQTVCFLQQLRNMPATRVPGPFLIISPLSLIAQWQSEVAMWAPDMNCVQLHGSQEARDIITKYEFYYQPPHVDIEKKREYARKSITKFDILLTTYEVAMRETRLLCKFNWQVMVVDEAHRLKNSTSKLFEQLGLIPKEHCLLLTGTPMQNRTEELWSLMNFADKEKFDDQESFVARFGDLKDAAHVGELHAVLKPYLLRRIKEDVEKSLPPKQETIVEVSLTSTQKQFYRAIYEKNTSILFKGVKQSNQPSLMNVMMELRKCCNHPYLCRGVEDLVLNEIPPELRALTPAGAATAKPGSSSAASVASLALGALSGRATNDPALNDTICQKLINSSGKLVLLDKLLPRLYEQGHKVLIFSQMVRVLNLLEDYVRYRGYLYERLDGSLRSTLRTAAVKRFCAPVMKRFIMLLSTKAGGLGLNLTAADTVIIFDSDWNPHNDLQAQARAHRIGQTKAVMVYRLLTRKTYEMHMFHMASMKLGMDRAVLAHARNEAESEAAGTGGSGGGGSVNDDDDGSSSSTTITAKKKDTVMNAQEIDELLKRGAYDVFREDESADIQDQQFAEADIDAIMQRQSHVVTHDASGSTVAKSLGSFSKASFVSADEKEDVDIHDPDFWRKAIGLENNNTVSLGLGDNYGTVGGLQLSEEQLLEIANLPQQRKRKQTVHYGSSEHDAAVSADGKRGIGGREELSSDSDSDGEGEGGSDNEGNGSGAGGGNGSGDKKGEKKDKKERERMENIWGAHARDRLVRGLIFFGHNSRCLRLRRECGAQHRELKDIQSMSEAYMLQCGKCVLETTGNTMYKNDTVFLKEQVEKAQALKMFLESQEEGSKKLGEDAIPDILNDERFVAKLKTGLARKVLNKMDTILRVTDMTVEACKKAYVAKRTRQIAEAQERAREAQEMVQEQQHQQQMTHTAGAAGDGDDASAGATAVVVVVPAAPATLSPEALAAEAIVASRDPDVLFSSLTIAEVVAQMPLGDTRPQWTKVAPWWDRECDKQLILACFQFGYGKYDMTLEGEEADQYLFKERLEQYRVEVGEITEAGEVVKGEESVSKPNEGTAADGMDADAAMAAVATTTEPNDMKVTAIATVTVTPKLPSKGRTLEEGEEGEEGEELEPEEDNEDGEDGDDEEGGIKGNGDGAKSGGRRGCPRRDALTMLPDVRSLNRLLAWLVTSDAARSTRKQVAECKKKRHRRSKEEMEAARREAAILGETAGRSVAAVMDRSRTPKLVDESWLIGSFKDVVDPRGVGLVYADNGRLLKRCERYIRPLGVLPYTPHIVPIEVDAPLLPGSETPAPVSVVIVPVSEPAPVSVSAPTNVEEGEITASVDTAATTVATTATAATRTATPAISAAEMQRRLVKQQQADALAETLSQQQAELGISDDEVYRISAALIRYGAPADAAPLLPLPTLVQQSGSVAGSCQLDTVSCGAGATPPLYNWEAFRQLADITADHHDAEFIKTYYHRHFVPFCMSMAKHGISPTCTKAAAASAAAAGKGFKGFRLVPHPFKLPMEHCHAARGMCQIFTVRQQMLAAIRFIFDSSAATARLQWFLRSAYGRDVRGMPVWWCPWVHDMGALRSCLYYGYLNSELMCLDRHPATGTNKVTSTTSSPLLPFHLDSITRFVRRVFLTGSLTAEPVFVANDFDGDSAAADTWCVSVSRLFPDYTALELRCMRILEAVTHPATQAATTTVLSYVHVDPAACGEVYRGAGLFFLPESVVSTIPFPGSTAEAEWKERATAAQTALSTTVSAAVIDDAPAAKRIKMEMEAGAMESAPYSTSDISSTTASTLNAVLPPDLTTTELARVFKCKHCSVVASASSSHPLRNLLSVSM